MISGLEYYFGLDYEKELQERKEEEKLREQGLQIPPKPKEIIFTFSTTITPLETGLIP
jgi:hypothetical protein